MEKVYEEAKAVTVVVRNNDSITEVWLHKFDANGVVYFDRDDTKREVKVFVPYENIGAIIEGHNLGGKDNG